MPERTEVAVFGGGCFWCVEAVFERVNGVIDARSGYAGGHVDNPTYAEVCGKETGHAEVCRIEFDPSVVSYDELLDIFFATHDPSTMNRQGADVGPQYRSIILTTSEAQRASAQARIADLTLGSVFGAVTTEVVPLTKFWPAEIDHQDYFARNPDAGYCQVVIAPKLEKFEKKFDAKLKSSGD